ncbi:T9SS type A sorting domain-containing protein [Aequorivita sp. H23M31]|uniref:T9SS type A sorting domain-containing protein n=1 Tax=Aequorivita ciconiae TaxID=2494375 RepID=A0A410G5I8_9FLAO|nr:T9SS type A sorting domain-containing protein [Aequorivita sp. H23M31]QAA82523.1 T9SS type A sorting domain-containing protein [Aequorivita sp. H23M31]
MKTILYILVFHLGAISFAQDPQLFENDWYLQNLVIDDIEYLPPNSQAEGLVFFTIDQFSAGNNYCQFGFTGVITYSGENLFSIEDVFAFGPTCGDQEVLNFTDRHFSIYVTYDLIGKNPISYVMTINGSDKLLEVTNPDGDKAFYGNFPLAIGNYTQANFSVYPNPSQDKLFVISSKDLDVLKIQIFNWEGRLLNGQTSFSGKQIAINVSDLSSGIYFLKLFDRNGTVEIVKFIKE